MIFTEELFDSIASIIAALIACWALLRTSKIEFSQKGQRSHWFFDDYLLSVGRCIGDFENNKVEYYANYMRYLLYADREIEKQMKNIDNVISSGDKKKIIIEVEETKRIYNQKYKTNQYHLKSR